MYSLNDVKVLDKKKVSRIHHRWTEEDTNNLLDNVIAAMKNTGNNFERPTARKFYSEFCNSDTIFDVDWITKRHKMRHLKATYIKAREWKENVGAEMFESDKKHINARIKKMCPYYNKLDEIFGPITNADPIGSMVMDEDTTIDNSFKNHESREYFAEELNSLLIPKQEQLEMQDEAEAEESETELLMGDSNHYNTKSKKIIFNSNAQHRIKAKSQLVSTEGKKQPADFERMKFNFEKEKFELTYRLETRKLNFEKEKLEFEKTKFFETQKLRKYEIDKQFDLKMMEIQKDERMQRLDYEEKTFDSNEN